MSHGRMFYSCGCLHSQCKCPGPHKDEWLRFPCAKHVKSSPPGFAATQWPRVQRIEFEAAWLELDADAQVDEDRERLIARVWD